MPPNPTIGGLVATIEPLSILAEVGWVALVVCQLLLFGLALVLTLISYQAYSRQPSQRLEYAFIGFAFISMGVGVMVLMTQHGSDYVFFQIAEIIPFIIGFALIYISLYR